MPPTKKAENINDNFFNGFYKDIWRLVVPGELSVKEVDFMQNFFNLKSDSSVLDIMCGFGRHAIGLARKEIKVTAVDNLADYITEIRQTAEQEALPLTAICNDVLQFNSNEKFDLAICMGNSMNFFDAEETSDLLAMISSHLKPGGFLFINTWSLTEIVTRNFKEKAESKIGDLSFLTNCKFLFHPTRIEIDSIIIAPDGFTETKKAVDFIFSVNEMETMLNRAGLILKENFSIPGKKNFTIGDARAYIVAEKK